MNGEIELLVTVKAYPAISGKYGEVVCVAGIRLDVDPPRWCRLYPVQFRDLADDQRFKKYEVIRLRANAHSGDARPESLRPDNDSIRPTGRMLASWEERGVYVEPLIGESMCAIVRQQQVDKTSLGAFRPARVDDLVVDAAEPWDPKKEAIASQPSLLVPTKKGLEPIPYRFKYRYRCGDAACNGHEQSIIDWELGAAFRSWRRKYGSDRATIEAVRTKWLGEMCSPERDTVFFVGNGHQYPDSFMILGVYWPSRASEVHNREVAEPLF